MGVWKECRHTFYSNSTGDFAGGLQFKDNGFMIQRLSDNNVLF